LVSQHANNVVEEFENRGSFLIFSYQHMPQMLKSADSMPPMTATGLNVDEVHHRIPLTDP
jgi:hypothetical protein